ncbi:hypothetical protein LCGC14_2801060 [marine sediment metagenome]|uniref:Uncharacterized protein n=1 Tax=marine sediment metagenome TaxID=412755 RepID=A0A0F9AW43_9ZZZZ
MIWTTKDGRRLKLSEMATPHIRSCISMLEGLRARSAFMEDLSKYQVVHDIWTIINAREWILAFELELTRRSTRTSFT